MNNNLGHLFKRYGSMFAVCLLVIIGFYFLMLHTINQSVQMTISREATLLIDEKGSSITEEDITNYWSDEAEVASFSIETVSENRIPEINWSTFSVGDLTPDNFERVLDETSLANRQIITWKKDNHFWLATALNEETAILVQLPQTAYNSLFRILRYGTILLIIALLIIILLNYYKANQKVHVSLATISQGINQISQQDYPIVYNRQNYPPIDAIGDQIVDLGSRLEKQQNVLSSSEQKLSLMLDHIILGVLVIDANGKIELFNPAAARLLKFDDSALGRSFESVVKSYMLANMIRTVMQTRQPLSDEIEMFVPNAKYVDTNIVPFGDENKDEGEQIDSESVLVLLYDISEIRRLETVRTEFVANASHELRTPVTAIKGFAETLLTGALDNPTLAQQFVQIIANESERLDIIIHDILELSRVERQSVPMTMAKFDMVEVAQSTTEFFLKKASQKQMDIRIDAKESIYYEADRHRIEQIFTNLIDNAINYSEAGSTITIRLRKKKKGVLFSVTDTGIGIPESDQERVFERFYRVDKGRSRNSGGTGLGLSIVRNLVKVLNGKIELESQVGVGSTFKVYLPYR